MDVILIIKTFVLIHFEKHNAHLWRETKLWNKECDFALKAQIKTLKRLFSKYSGKYTKPGKPVFMSIDEFQQMISDSGILTGGAIGPGEIGARFNVAMMTQVKELETERHTNMFFLEFIEAICRVADALEDFPSTYLPSSKSEEVQSVLPDVDTPKPSKLVTLAKINQFPLQAKITMFLQLLSDTIFSQTSTSQ